MTQPPTFKQEMFKAVNRAIAHLDKGTVGIGDDCLWQLTVRYLRDCPHAPMGTNAAFVARETFNEVVGEKPFNRFVYRQ